MNKHWISALTLLPLFALYLPSAQALPLGNMRMIYVANEDGTYTYHFRITNFGPPVAPNVATPPDHQIWDWRNNQFIPAGGKFLDNDENVFVFGVDTQRDDIVISNVSSGFNSDFSGIVENGFSDSDNDGTPNLVIGWLLPNAFTLDQMLQPGEAVWFASFTLDEEISEFVYWIGGSDDTIVWDADVLEDEYGIYDTSEEAYVATFLTRTITAVQKLQSSEL